MLKKYGWQLISMGFLSLLSPLAVASTTINHQFTPATIYPGDISKYRIAVTNDDTGSGLSNMQVTSILQPQITIASPLNITANTCGFTVNQPLAPGASTLELTGGSIAASALGDPSQCYFEVEVTSTTPGNWPNTIPGNSISEPNPPGTPAIVPDSNTQGYVATTTIGGVLVTNSTPATATLAVNALLPPTGSKSFNPSPAVAGNPVTLTITLSNPNTNATMPLTSFIDALPDDGNGHAMLVDGTPSVSCTGTGAVNGSVTAAGNNKSITLAGGTIGQGGSCVISVPVKVNSIDGVAQTFTNSLAAGAIGNTRGLQSPAFSTPLTVNTPIQIGKSFSVSPIPAGQPSLMTLTVTNNGSVDALDVAAFSDNLTGTTLKVLTTASSPVAAPANPAVSCTGAGAVNGTLAYVADTLDTTVSLSNAKAGPGGVCTVSVWVTSNAGGPHNNTTSTVSNPVNNYASTPASASITVFDQLTVEKSATVENVAPGQWTEFSIKIKNYTGAQVNNVQFKDLLPVSSGHQMVVFDPITPPGIYTTSSGCIAGTFTGLNAAGSSTGNPPVSGIDAGLQWSGGSIEAGSGVNPGECVITLRVQLPASAPAGTTFSNNIGQGTITGDGIGGGVSNPDTAGVANVVTVDSIAVIKEFTPVLIAQGGISTLTISVYNRVVNAVSGINLTDNLPAGVTLAANPAPTSTCNGTIQAFPGSGQIKLVGGSLAARPDYLAASSCKITVKVTSSGLGTYTNTISPGDFSSSVGTISGPVTADLQVSSGITGSKKFTPASVSSGGISRAVLTITNGSNTQLTNVSINDTGFSSGLAVANPANAASNCAGSPTLVVNPGANSVQLLGAELNAGTSCTLSFDVSTSGSGPWVNNIPAGNVTSAEGPSNSAAITANLGVIEGSIGLNKSFLTPIVTGGVPSVLQIDVTNNASIAVHGATFTDTFPSGIVVYSVPATSTTCAGGTVTAIPGDGKVTLSGATLAPTATCKVLVTTTSVRYLNLTNTIPAGAVSSDEGYTNPLPTIATLSTLQGLGVMKGFSPAFIGLGQTSRLKVTLVNTFDPSAIVPQILNGVSFTDTLPAGLTVAATPAASTTCPSGVVTATTGAGSVSLSGASIIPGSNCVIEVNVTASGVGVYDNTIPKDGVTSAEGVKNQNPATARLTVVTDPTIAKAFSVSPVQIGQVSKLTVTINNSSGTTLTGVSLVDTLPAGLAIATIPNSATNCSNGVVLANAGDSVLGISGAVLTTASSCTFSADVVANTAGSYANSIAAGKLVNDQGLSNPAPVSATLVVLPPASVSKSFSPVSINAGGVSTLTINLENSSTSAITLTADFVDALPGNVLVAPTPNLGGTCAGVKAAVAGGTSVSLANGSSIPPGGCTLVVDVTSSVSGSYVNVIAAGQMQTSAGNNQDPAIATLGVDQPAAPTISKSFSPATIFVDEVATLTIALGNSNTTALTLSSILTDTLPAGVVVATPPAIGGSCTTGGVGAVAGGSSITYANGASIPAGGCTISVDVSSSVAGSYTNFIAAGELQTDGGSPPEPATDGLVVKTLVPPSVQKNFNPSTINPGGVSTLTIVLNNENAGAITLQSDLVDNLPANVLVAPAPAIGGSCPGTINATAGSSTVIYNNGSQIPAGGCTITVNVTSAIPGGPYVNTIPAGALETDAGNNGAAAVASLLVNPFQPPSVSKSFSPTPLPKNATSVLTISLRNGNDVAITLTDNFVDTLPANVVIANPNGLLTSAGCNGTILAPAGGNTVTVQSGSTLAADSGCTIQINVTSATAGTYTNTIAAGAVKTNAGDNAVGATAPVQFLEWPSSADILLGKSISPATGIAGSTHTVTLTWRNQNPQSPVQNLYQCVISDPLPTDAFDPTTVVAGVTPAGYTFSLVGNTVSYTRTDTTTPCETTLQTATFTAKLKANVVTGSTYTNTATVTAKTLASNDPNAASAATLTRTASATVAATAPAVQAKTVLSTSQNFTDPGDANVNSNPVVAIGETVTYSIPYRLSPGVTNAVILVDEITTGIGDVALVSATLARSSGNLSAVSNPANINAAAVNTPVDVTAQLTTNGNEFRLPMGNITNSDAANQTYTMVVTLRIANVAANTLGHLISDRGRLRFQNASNVVMVVNSGTKSVHVGLPGVKVTKSVLPAAPSAGDTVTYTLTVSNPSVTNAVTGFNLTFTDTLPASLVNPANLNFTPGVVVGAAPVTAGSFTGNVLSGTIDRLDPNESVVITYTADIPASTPFGKTIVNAVSGTTTTLPGVDPNERTISSQADAATLITATPSITKTVMNPQSRYAIGDVVLYRLTISLPVGTTTNFNIRDTLPAGLAYVANSATLGLSTGVSGPAAGTINPVAPPLTFQLGSITATTPGTMTIDFMARVENVWTNQDNTPLTNTAQATYDKPEGGLNTITAPNPPAIVVGEPNFTMNKTIVSGATGSQAGSTVRWSFTVQNSGSTIAYQATVSDTLPPGLMGITNISVTPASGNIQLNNVGCSTGVPVAATTAVVSTTNNTDDTITLADLCFAPGTTLTVAFDTTVMNSVTPGEVLNNVVTGTYASQASGNSTSNVVRDGAATGTDDDTDPQNGTDPVDNYNESASNMLTIDAPIAIDKQASTESATVGETLTYTLQVALIQGNTPALIVTDELPLGLTYLSSSISMGNVGITPSNGSYATRLGSGQTVQFDFGNVQNNPNGNAADDFISIDITVRVDNVASNQNAEVLKNGEGGTVTVQYGATPTTIPYDFDGATPGIQGRPLTITEPDIETTKSAVPASQSLGDIVTYTITIAHTAGSTADAYDVVLTDTLPAGLDFIPGSVLPANAYVGIAGQVLSLKIDPSDPLTLIKHQTTITYQARISTAAVVGTPLSNQVTGTYSSIPGATGSEDSGRNGSGGINNYTVDASADVTPNQSALVYPTKTVEQITDDGDGVLEPGEIIEYTVILNNTSAVTTLTNLLFTDTIPPQTTYVAATLSSSTGTPDDSAAPDLEVSIASLAPGANATITFRVEVNAGVPAGTVISNQGSVDSDQTVPTPTDEDGVPANGAQPTLITVGGTPTPDYALYAEKLVALLTDNDSSGTVTQGDRMRYTIVLHNTGGSTLNGVSFSDVIPADLTYVAASATASTGTVNVAGQNVSWTGLVAMAPGTVATATFDVTITSVTAPSQTYVNQGTATSTETGPVLTDSNGSPSDGNQPTRFTALNGGAAEPVLNVQKRSAVIIDTAPVGVASPGDTLQYTVTVSNNGSAAATNVRFTDPVPVCSGALNPCTAYVNGSLTSSQGAIVTQNPIDVNLGTLPVGGVATLTFRVLVDLTTENGVVVANQAFVTRAGSGTPVPSDDNGNPNDGLNPTLTPISTSTAGGVPGSLAKTLEGSSETDSIGATVLIGEVARYQVAVGMPKGTLKQVGLLDTLPEGLSYLPGSARLARVFNTGLTASADPGGVNSAASGSFVALTDGTDIVIASGINNSTTLNVFLGDVINSDNDSNLEQYLLQYRVVVDNVQGNQDGTTLTNAATVSFWNSLSQPQSLTPENFTLTVDEPEISLDKAVSPSALLSTGGTVTFTLTLANAAGAAAAYDLVLSDVLPAQFTSMGARTITPSGGASGIVDNSTGTTIDIGIAKMEAGSSVQVSFTATAPGPLSTGPITNTANTTWTTLPGTNGSAADGGVATPGAPGSSTGERTGSGSPAVNNNSDSDPATVQVGASNITKELVDQKTRYAIGDTVKYKVEVTVPGSVFGTLGNVEVSDILDEGLSYVSGTLSIEYNTASSSSNPADFTRSDNTPSAGEETLSLSLGTVSNSNTAATTIVLTYSALVDNILSNQDNDSLSNKVELAFSDPGAGGATTTRGPASTTVAVGEPFLELSKTLTTPAAGLEAGDTASFVVLASNSGSTTAFDTVISDLLPAGLYFPSPNSGDVVVAVQGAGQQVPTVTVNADDWESSSFDLLVGSQVSFTFTVTLDVSVIPGQSLQNGVTGTFSSRPGTDANERNGDDGSVQTDGSTLDNYNNGALSSTITVSDPIAIDKIFSPDPGKNRYAIGELVTYRLRVSLLEGTTEDLVVVDVLPNGLVYEGSSQPGTAAGVVITHEYSGSPGVAGQVITYDLGTVTNEPNNSNLDDYITIDVMARVANVAGNQGGTVLGNNASVSFTGPGGTVERDFDADSGEPGIQPLDLTVIVPDMVIGKDDGATAARPGDTVSYTLTYQNVGEADATGVVITETVPALTTFSVASSSAGWVCLPNAAAGSTCTLPIGSVEAGAAAAQVTFAVIVDSPWPTDVTQISNSVSIEDDLPLIDDPTPDDNSDGDDTPVNDPRMTVEKSSVTTELSAPQTVIYSYLVSNTGNLALTNISLSDDNDNDDMVCEATTLAVGETMTCTASHTFSQLELNANGSPLAGSGVLSNTVTASSDEAEDATDDLDITIIQNPLMSVTKTATSQGPFAVGETITYNIVVKNEGNIPLHGVVVDDPLTGTLQEICGTGTLDLDEDCTVQVQYTVSQGDLDNNGNGDGDIDNTATGSSNEAPPVDGSEEVDLVDQDPSMRVEKSSTTSELSAPGTVTYSYLVTNTGNITLTGVGLVDDNDNDDMSCPRTTLTVAPDANSTMTCTATHTFTQQELDANGSPVAESGLLNNTVVASSDQAEDASDDMDIPITQSPSLQLVKTATPQTYSVVGDVIDYSYELTNTGNVSLYPPYSVDDDKSNDETCPLVPARLAPGDTVVCSATYEIDTQDIENGTVTNVATASAQDRAGQGREITSNQDEETVILVRVNLSKEVNGPAQLQNDGSYTVVYTITATNEGVGPAVYNIIDQFDPATGISLNTVDIAYVGGTEVDQSGDIGDYPNLVSNEGLGSGLSESWTLTANFVVDPAMVIQEERSCGDGGQVEPGTGFYNAVSGSESDITPEDNVACTGLPDADIGLSKSVLSGPEYDIDTGLYTVVYRVVASNAAEGAGVYDITDTFLPAVGISLSSATIDFTPQPGNETLQTGAIAAPGTLPHDFASGDTVVTSEGLFGNATETWTVTAEFDVDLALVDDSASNCLAGAAGEGTGFYNYVTGADHEDLSDNDACASLPSTVINLSKEVVSAVDMGVTRWRVVYQVTVSNSGAVPGLYNLVDTFSPGVGMTLVHAELSAYVPGTEDSQTGSLLVGSPLPQAFVNGTELVNNEQLEPGRNESWTITAEFEVDPLLTDDTVACREGEGGAEGTGFYNYASGSGTDPDMDDNKACYSPNISDSTTFRVTKRFADGNPMDVEVTLDCNTGLLLKQKKMINESKDVVFVMTSFTPGGLSCDVYESIPEGYTPEYTGYATENGFAHSVSSDTEGCHFDEVEFGEFVCEIVNSPKPVEIEIEKLWVMEGTGADQVDTSYQLTLYCDGEIVGGNNNCSHHRGNEIPSSAGQDGWCTTFEGRASDTYTASVIPDYPSTQCSVLENVFSDAIEIDNGCQDLEVSAGQGDYCLITNTVFFEGIPTLNQWGMMLMVLMMAGIGMVGFRRLT